VSIVFDGQHTIAAGVDDLPGDQETGRLRIHARPRRKDKCSNRLKPRVQRVIEQIGIDGANMGRAVFVGGSNDPALMIRRRFALEV